MKSFITTLILLLVYFGTKKTCTMEIYNIKSPDKLLEINYENILKNKKQVSLSQVASSVEYIKLETNSTCMINAGARYLFTDSLIFVSNRDHILKFSRIGKFLKKIGNPGRGPGEIVRVVDMSLIPESNTVLVYYRRKLLYFSFDGKFIKSVNTGSDMSLRVMEDGRYIAYNPGYFGREEYTFRLTNEQNETISGIKNLFKWVNPTGIIVGFVPDYLHPFYSYGNKTFFKALYNDTVYTVNKNKIEPYCYVNLGKYKLPNELRDEYLVSLGKPQLSLEKSEKYYYCNVLEAADIIFLESLNYMKNTHNFFLFDKKIDHGFLLVDNNVKVTSISNDYDGGLNFWPAGSVNDKQVFMPIDIVTFKKELEKTNISGRTNKYPDKQKQLEKMISNSDISDNPVIMVVTLKSNN